jgi:CRP-like cAMP-binding protein
MQEKLREHFEKIITLTDEEFAFVLSHFTFRKYKKHQFLIQQGDRVNHTFFVVSGLLRLSHTDSNDKEHILLFAMEDWWVSDDHAFLTGTNATMSLDCLEDTSVFCISLEDNQKLFAAMPKMEHFFLKKSHRGYIALQQRLLSLLSSSAAERYERLLMQYPSLMQRVNKTLLASYLGVSRETLSRLSS